MFWGVVEQIVVDGLHSIWGESIRDRVILVGFLLVIVATTVLFSTIWKQFSVYIGKDVLGPFFHWVFHDLKNSIIFILVVLLSSYVLYNTVIAPLLVEYEAQSSEAVSKSAPQSGSNGQQDSSPRAGLTKLIDFPLAGQIAGGTLSFSFSVECENDYYVTLTSPTGLTQGFMDRGLNRCSGQMSTFTSFNNSMARFIGAEASGEWAFNIRDADANEHSGSLVSLQLSLTVSDGASTISHVVSVGGLPASIPN